MDLSRYARILYNNRLGFGLSPASLTNYLKNRLYSRTSELVPERCSPVVAQLFVTDRCNLRCQFCSRNLDGKREAEPDMGREMFERILEAPPIRKTLGLILSGGEPLLHPHVLEFIKMTKSRKKICALITNGLLLPDMADDLKKSGVDDIQASIYDHTAGRMGRLLPDICRKIPVNASYVLLRSVVESNPQHICDIVRMCFDSGCRSVKLNLYVKNDTFGDSELIHDDCEGYTELRKRLEDEYRGRRLYVPGPIPRKIRGRQDKGCLMPWQHILVDPKGRVAMCCGVIDAAQLGEGTIFDADAGLRTYNAPVFTRIRRLLLEPGPAVDEHCRNCPYLSGQSFASRL